MNNISMILFAEVCPQKNNFIQLEFGDWQYQYLRMLLGKNKEEVTSKSNRSNLQPCAICTHSDPETTSILHALLQKFVINKNEGLSEKRSREEQKFELISFHRLLSTIFAKKYSHFKTTLSCSHENLKDYFCQFIKCSHSQLDNMSDQITWKRAKYNYHIDVLNQQIKTFPRLLATKKVKKIAKSRQKNEEIEDKGQKNNSDRDEKGQGIEKFQTQAKIEEDPEVCQYPQNVATDLNSTYYQQLMYNNNAMGLNFDRMSMFDNMIIWPYPYQSMMTQKISEFSHAEIKQNQQQ